MSSCVGSSGPRAFLSHSGNSPALHLWGLDQMKCPGLAAVILFSAAQRGGLEGSELLLHFMVGKLIDVYICPNMCYWFYLGSISQVEK